MSDDTGAARVAVLAFHSISPAPGPTSIDADTFRMQLDLLGETGFASMNCRDFLAWHQGRGAGAKRVLITFDDGFADFATTAYPILRERGFGAIVFVPTGKLGQRDDWRGGHAPPRPLMSWATVGDLALAGVEFGGHGVTHADLTRLSPEQRREEIERSAQDLADRLGRRPTSFAPPYGRVNSSVLADVARVYELAFGTRFDRARAQRDRFDVPRIEMHYFRAERHWGAFLRGERSYFLARRALRSVKNAWTSAARELFD
jgi:peptidoglycan/xylan/chitin deacetylase (PgdA/CDA1 family)